MQHQLLQRMNRKLDDCIVFNNIDVDFNDIKQLIYSKQPIRLGENAAKRIVDCRNYLDNKLSATGGLFYGINTGFGFLQNVAINHDQTEELQSNLIQSHACGLGTTVPDEIVRLMLLFKIKSLSFGHSGVQLETVQRLIDFYNNDVLPVVYTQGSLGASGDLAPLSHLCLPLLGLGKVKYKGEIIEAKEVLEILELTPLHLKSKEGLALINGTQFMSSYGLFCLNKANELLKWCDAITAISLDAFDGSIQPFNPAIHKIRSHEGQVETAQTILEHLKGSEIAESDKKQVQDPYSFRCVPQVHGASKDTFHFVLNTFIKEVNSVTDNPNIFPDEDLILSGGNFHGQPLALGLDYLAMAIAEIGNISERRTFQLLSGQRGLPLFLIKNPGLHSGFMIPQYTAAGIVSENKQLCTPASVDSITSSNGQEDHVSMGANAATKCLRVLDNVEKVLAIELMSAAQALEFRRPHKSSPFLESIVADFRKVVSFNDADRILHVDMISSISFLRTYFAKYFK